MIGTHGGLSCPCEFEFDQYGGGVMCQVVYSPIAMVMVEFVVVMVEGGGMEE